MSNTNTASSHSNSISSTYLNGTAAQQQQLNSTGNSNVVYQTLRSRKTNKSAVPLDERVFLDKAFGFTIQSNTRISQSCDGTIAYLAGCVIVIYNCNDIQNQAFIISPAKKTLTCVAFSADGRMLATGESGHDPKVRVWDVREKIQLCEFSGHKFAIECVAFSTAPNSSLLVSVGSMHDMVVNVWNCRTKFKVASNKVACKVKGIAFSQDGSYFVTVGNRHVKFWYLTVSSLLETVPLRGRAGILGDMKNNYFCDVVCGRGANSHLTYAITTNGVLCEFNENRCLSSIAELHVERAYCIYADDANLFIGCSNGTILIFRQKILDFISSLSRPHYLGIDISKGQDTSHVLENINNPNLVHPDCIALVYDKFDYVLSAFYNDHSFYVWDIKDLDQVKKVDSHLFHSSSCGSIDTFSSVFLDNASNQLVVPQFPSADSSCFNMPMDSFVTCSSDNTVRIWTMNSLQRDEDGNNSSRLQRNIYSKELLKIIYIDNDLSALCEIDTSVDTSDPATERALATSQSTSQLSKSSTDNALQNEVKMGARCIKISPHGRHLATGDRNGNIRVYDLSTLESICMIEAHIAEVLDLQYSQPESGRQLLASSSRDRLIHIFDASKNTYDLLQIIGDHSSAITAVRFCFNSLEKQLYIISCGADKSIMFRTAILDSNNNSSVHSPTHSSSNSTQSPTKYSDFVRTSYVAEKQTFHDMNVDPTRTYLNTISQDRMIREYSVKDGKKIRQFRGSLNEDGYLVKMDMDRTGQLMATACTDKIVYIWDMKSTECLAYLYGHSENINDLKFTNDGQYLITVGADGCLFTWRITNLYSYLTNPTSNNMVHSQSVNSLLTSRNMLRQSLSMPISNLTNNNTIQQPTPVPSVNHQHHNPEKLLASSTQEILDGNIDSDESLPAWARKKLDGNANNMTITMASTSRSSWATSTGTLDLDSLAGSRRSGRAVWGQQINTSFAVAVDSELNSLTSQSSMPNEVTEEATPPKSQHKNLNCIQFPSPCVNKDSYQVKQVSIEHKQVKTGASQRPSWICSNNEDDFLFNMNRSGDSSGDDIDTPSSPVKLDDDEAVEHEPVGTDSKSNNLVTKDIVAENKCNGEFNVEEKEVTVDFNIAPLSFDSEYTKLMHDIPPCLNTPICRQQPTTNTTCMSLGGGTTGVDSQNPIKLNCDMENSFRRSASISARYLLRTAAQQQKESQQNSLTTEAQIDPCLTPIKSASKPEKESNLSEALNQLKNETPVLEPSSEKMQPPPATVPLPQMSNEFKIRSRTRTSVGGANFQLLYSHHTESSLSKAKPKQPQQFHSSNNLSKDVSTSENNKANNATLLSNHHMKRSPSVNSITISVSQCDSKSQESSSSIASSSATSSTSSIKHSSKQSAKSSPSRQPGNILTRSNTLDIHQTNGNEAQVTKPGGRHTINVSTTSIAASNLKKASSMLALNQGPVTKTRNKSTTQAHQLTKESQFLPPKTVRQVKQRSADRQLTTGGIVSQSSCTNKPALNSFSNFAEQNKHLRKLSSSIQNLHTQQSSTNTQATTKSPTSISIKTEEPEPVLLTTKPSSETNKTLANNPSNNSSNELDLMNKLKKIDADQMSLSSSSVECLGQNENDPIQLNTLDNDLDLLPNQPHSSSHTSNSLTSSSSSSCSLFESNTNQSNEPNELKSARDLNEDEDKECQQPNTQRPCSDLDSNGPFNLSSFASTISSLKKPVTFASISKSKSANSSPNIISYTNPSKFNNGQSNSGFSNSKVDSIRSEFFQNVKNLQFVLSQGSKNLDDYLKCYQKPSHQQLKSLLTDQANQQIQHQIHSFVKQLNAVVNLTNANESNNSANLTNSATTTNNTNNTNINNNSEEIELA